MRQVTRQGLISVAAAGGVLAISGGAAHADAGADSAAVGSPGVLSGNSVQAPVHVPVNACGNTVNGVGALNPAMGNNCVNTGAKAKPGARTGDDGGSGRGGSQASGKTKGSPGVASGNSVQAPVHVPVNACGNSVNVVGAGNAAAGNNCANTSGHTPHDPEKPGPDKPGPEDPDTEDPGTEDPDSEKPDSEKPGDPDRTTPGDTTAEHPAGGSGQVQAGAPQQRSGTAAEPTGELARTGSTELGALVPAGAGLLLGGYLLYRRSRTAQR